MSRKVQAKVAILDYLKSIYPRSATEKEILKEIGLSGCACSGALRTLRSRGSVEQAGKKGKSNLYKFKPN